MRLIKDIKSSAVKEAFNREEAYKTMQKGNKDTVSFGSREGKFPETNGRESFYLKFTGNKSKHELWD